MKLENRVLLFSCIASWLFASC